MSFLILMTVLIKAVLHFDNLDSIVKLKMPNGHKFGVKKYKENIKIQEKVKIPPYPPPLRKGESWIPAPVSNTGQVSRE